MTNTSEEPIPAPLIEMNDLPRQEDLRRTSALFDSGQAEKMIPTINDIYTLLTFTNYLYGKGKHSRLDRITSRDISNPPLNAPTRQRWRFSDVLDSIANICVSQARGDVVAIAIRPPDKAADKYEIIVAANNTVSHDTVNHLKIVWGLLRDISMQMKNLPEYRNITDSPPRIRDPRVMNLRKQLEMQVIKYTFLKVQKRVTSKVERFLSMSLNDVSDDHPIHRVNKVVRYIDRIFMRSSEGGLLESPPIDKDDAWDDLRMLLKEASDAIQNFTTYIDREPKARPYFMNDSLLRYLRKVKSGIADIEVVTRAAVSPQCRGIFEKTPMITGLSKKEESINMLPTSIEQWEEALKRPLTCYNQLPHVSSRRVMNTQIIHEDCVEMINRGYLPKGPVHCEAKLLIHLYTESHHPEHSKGPAYSYIGLSKLCCLPCYEFVQAWNEVFGTRFFTKGTHSKVYVPWAFPDDCPFYDTMVDNIYKKLANHLVPWYDGYAPENRPLSPDSTAQSNPTQGGVESDDIGHRVQQIFEEWDARMSANP